LDTQVKKILNTTAEALKKVALSKKPKPEKGHPKIRDEEFLEVRSLIVWLILAKSSTSTCRSD
jgi:hypothetical protein